MRKTGNRYKTWVGQINHEAISYMFIYILFKGPNGFDELRKFIKHSSDFTKEVASILHERFVTIFYIYIYIGIVDSD